MVTWQECHVASLLRDLDEGPREKSLIKAARAAPRRAFLTSARRALHGPGVLYRAASRAPKCVRPDGVPACRKALKRVQLARRVPPRRIPARAGAPIHAPRFLMLPGSGARSATPGKRVRAPLQLARPARRTLCCAHRRGRLGATTRVTHSKYITELIAATALHGTRRHARERPDHRCQLGAGGGDSVAQEPCPAKAPRCRPAPDDLRPRIMTITPHRL